MNWLYPNLVPLQENSTKIVWLVRMRWMVIGLQLLALIPGAILEFVKTSNIWWYLAVITSAPLLNLYSRRYRNGKEASTHAVAFQIMFDVTQLFTLLSLAGGWTNPFTALILIYVSIAGAILSKRYKLYFTLYIIAGVFITRKFFTFSFPSKYPAIDIWVQVAVQGIVVASLMILLASLSSSLINREKTLNEIRDRHLRMDRLRAIGTLSGAFCHQMASPVNSIKLRAARLARKSEKMPVLEDEVLDDVTSILNSVDKCENVLHKLTNIHLDPNEVIFQEQDLRELIDTCVKIWQKDPLYANMNVELDLPRSVYMNLPGVMLTQAVLDMLDNAAEACDHQGNISISLRESSDMLQIVFEDDGAGFPEHILKQLGEPFNTSKSQGNGLGLYHASLLSQLLGGRLDVEARELKGSRITMNIAKERRLG